MLALVVLAFPLFAGDGDKAVSQGKNMIMMFTIGIFSLAMICLFALLVNFILYLVRRKKDKALIAVKRQYEVTVKENTDETKKVKRKRKNKKKTDDSVMNTEYQTKTIPTSSNLIEGEDFYNPQKDQTNSNFDEEIPVPERQKTGFEKPPKSFNLPKENMDYGETPKTTSLMSKNSNIGKAQNLQSKSSMMSKESDDFSDISGNDDMQVKSKPSGGDMADLFTKKKRHKSRII